MTVCRLPVWGFSCDNASFYGWRYAVHIGPWLVFFGKVRP
jgi:hypothetical protein